MTNHVCTASQAFATRHGRPLRYLESGGERKDPLARDLAEPDRIDDGFIGVFRLLEPCLIYTVRKDADA